MKLKLTVNKALICCEQALYTRWACKSLFSTEIRFFLPEYYTSSGGRFFVHPIGVIIYDLVGVRTSDSSNTIQQAVDHLGMSLETAKAFFDAANGEEPLDTKERSRVMEIRIELIERIDKVTKRDLHTFWSELKIRD